MAEPDQTHTTATEAHTEETDTDTTDTEESATDTDGVPELTPEEMARLLEPDPEPTAEEKALQALHLVRCRDFTEHDPKTNAYVCTRFCGFNIAFFDLDQESEAIHGLPLQELSNSQWRSIVESSVNVLSLKLIESDVGYPINVFGTVIARDEVDYKCVYLFRRERDDSQCIESPEDMLTLTGPSRGLVVSDRMFFEINLKIKGDATTHDRDFSKGVIEYSRLPLISSKRPVTELLTSWRSKVELVLAPVPYPVAATLKVNILNGSRDTPFNGKITAWTTGNVDDHIILYEHDGTNTSMGTGKLIEDSGSVVLTRNLVAVPVPVPIPPFDEDEEIVINVCFITGNDEDERTLVTIQYPQEEKVCNHGRYELQVKVSWTAIVRRPMSKGIHRRWCSVPRKPLAFYVHQHKFC
ncbi:uncharacterized protein LOC124673460 [Lolium rigidum]|uniref:uncharacterized protein LOC124673460 n=1 Tax=Lolium rigidum TaxID=89674 RepID=UPI001F5C52CE|nr:uncharacterized protein LOC124673460 [Lolium rigidum]